MSREAFEEWFEKTYLSKHSLMGRLEIMKLTYQAGQESMKEQTPQWISVEDRLPEKYESVLVWGDDCFLAHFTDDDDWGWEHKNKRESFSKVTHWQPIEPPQESK